MFVKAKKILWFNSQDLFLGYFFKHTFSILHNIIMVECQMWQFRQWPPFCFGSIILASDSNRLIDDSQICHCDCSPSWVTVNFGVRTYLIYFANLQSRFFFQFTYGTLLCSLIHIHKTARECPAALEGFAATFNQQHLRLSHSRFCAYP